MKTINVYETITYKNEDGTGNTFVGYFKHECDAEAAGEEFKGPGGRKWHRVTPVTMVVYDTFEEYETDRDKKIFDTMKRRLTDDEKRVLRSLGVNNI